MRYSTEQRFRKYVKEYGFLSFARTFGDKYGKKLMDTATKTGMNAAKTDCFEHKVWHHYIKMEFQKIANFLNTSSDDKNYQDLLLKFMINQKKFTTLTKKSELKRQC